MQEGEEELTRIKECCQEAAMFFSNYDTPGPGIDPDAPRAKGWTRIWEMISRDYRSFWLAGIVNVLTAFPFMFMIGYAYATHSILIAVAAGALCGMIAAPGFYGLSDTLLRSLRDEPGYWWHRYSKAVGNNWTKTIVPGMLGGIIFSIQMFILFHLQVLDGSLWLLISQIISMIVFMGILLWFLVQHALLEMPLTALLKNSILLFFRYITKSLAAAGIALGYLILILLIFPGSVFLLITACFWLPLLCSFQIIYPTVDEIFGIEKKLSSRYNGLVKDKE